MFLFQSLLFIIVIIYRVTTHSILFLEGNRGVIRNETKRWTYLYRLKVVGFFFSRILLLLSH